MGHLGRTLLHVKVLLLRDAATLTFDASTDDIQSLNVLAWCSVDAFKHVLRSMSVLSPGDASVQVRLMLPYGLGTTIMKLSS